MNRFKRIIGWAAFAVLVPFIAAGWVAYLIADAVLFGWEAAEEMMENW